MNGIMEFIKSVFEFWGHTPNKNEVGATYVICLFLVLSLILILNTKRINRKKENFLRCKIKY